MMRVLALDLGATVGWALADSPDLAPRAINSGIWQLYSGGGPGSRFWDFRRRLEALDPAPDLVLYELVRGHGRSGAQAAHHFGAYWGTVLAFCYPRRLAYFGVEVSDWKERAVGSRASKAPKPSIERTRQAFGDEVFHQDQADALWVLETGLELRMRGKLGATG